MKNLIIITTTQGDVIYNGMFLMSSLFTLAVLLYIGFKRKYPLHSWGLLILCVTVFSILGMYIINFTVSDWNTLLFSDTKLIQGGKSSMGAFGGMLVGVWLGQKLLKTSFPILDIYAFIIPVVLIFQRIGCLMAGCCHGTPTDSIWGVKYADHFQLFAYQLNVGIVGPDDTSTVAVHPVPVYFIIASIITFLFLLVVRNKFRRYGSLFLVTIISLGVFRFGIEFFRNEAFYSHVTFSVGSINATQWVTLLIVLLFSIILVFREKLHVAPGAKKPGSSYVGHWLIILILATMISIFYPFLEKVQILTVLIYFTVFMVGSSFTLKRRDVSLISGPVILVFIGFIFLGQRGVHNDESIMKMEQDEFLQEKIISHSIGFALGDLLASDERYSGSDCDRELVGIDRYEAKSSYGYFFESSKVYNTGKVSRVGIGFSAAPYRVNSTPSSAGPITSANKYNYAVGAYFGKEWATFGYNIGMWAGEMQYYPNGRDLLNVEKLKVAPILTLKMGDMKHFYFSGHLGDDFTYGLYRYFAKAGVGGGVDMGADMLRFHIGINERSNWLLDTSFPLSENWVIAPSITLGDEYMYAFQVKYRVIN